MSSGSRDTCSSCVALLLGGRGADCAPGTVRRHAAAPPLGTWLALKRALRAALASKPTSCLVGGLLIATYRLELIIRHLGRRAGITQPVRLLFAFGANVKLRLGVHVERRDLVAQLAQVHLGLGFNFCISTATHPRADRPPLLGSASYCPASACAGTGQAPAHRCRPTPHCRSHRCFLPASVLSSAVLLSGECLSWPCTAATHALCICSAGPWVDSAQGTHLH